MRVFGACGRSPAAGRLRTGSSPTRPVGYSVRCGGPAATSGGILPALAGGACSCRVDPANVRVSGAAGAQGLLRLP